MKKGEHSVRVARQYSGTAGRIANSQIGVFLAYASGFGQTLIDRRLYQPRTWAEDKATRVEAHVPEDIAFATEIAIARDMIAAALDAQGPHLWVLAVGSNHHLRFLTREGLVMADPKTIADEWPAQEWAMLAAGEGAKGLRLYDWARLRLPWITDDGFERWLLIRHNRKEPDKRAYYLVFPPQDTSLAELVGAAGLRWTIEECFERAKESLASITARRVLGMAGTGP